MIAIRFPACTKAHLSYPRKIAPINLNQVERVWKMGPKKTYPRYPKGTQKQQRKKPNFIQFIPCMCAGKFSLRTELCRIIPTNLGTIYPGFRYCNFPFWDEASTSREVVEFHIFRRALKALSVGVFGGGGASRIF